MEYVSEKLTEYIISKGIIKREDYALYFYGIQTGLETVICIIASMIIAVVTKSFIEYLMVLCVLMPIRSYTGGIHMKTFYSCFLCSVVVLTGGPLFIRFVYIPAMAGFFLSIISMAVLHILSYNVTKGNYDEAGVKYFAGKRLKIFAVIIVNLIIFYMLNLQTYIQLIFYALAFSMITVVLEIIKKIVDCK
jgi:accessory gene regulator B